MVLTEPYVDAGSKKLVMTFAVADRNGGETRAVAAGDVFMDVVAAAVTLGVGRVRSRVMAVVAAKVRRVDQTMEPDERRLLGEVPPHY